MKRAFTLLELLIVIIVVTVLLMLAVFLVQRSREAARRMQCSNNLRQLGLAVHNFHDVFKKWPKANFQPQFCREEFFNPETGGYGNRELYGILPVLIPYVASTPYYDILITQLGKEGDASLPWEKSQDSIATLQMAMPFAPDVFPFLCPSDGFAQNRTDADFGRTNYHGCRGDIWVDWKSKSTRGVFISGPNDPIGLSGIVDGTSNTLMFAECVIGNNHGGRDAPVRGGIAYGMPYGADAVPMRCLERAGQKGKLTGEQNHDVLTDSRGAGLCWMSGRQVNDQFFTILPPNAPSCSSETDWQDWALNSASSYHVGGCNVGIADGSVTFVSNDVGCGNLDQSALDIISPYHKTAESYTKGKSPWGVWGALGSRAEGVYGIP